MRLGWLFGLAWIWLAVCGGSTWAAPERSCAATDAVCPTNPQAWVTYKIAKGEQADLDLNCPDSDTNTCRLLPPSFVRRLIVAAAANNLATEQGITIRNAVICAPQSQSVRCDEPTVPESDPRAIISEKYEPLDLRDLRAKVAVDLVHNLFFCDLRLGGSYFEHILNLDDATIVGSIDMHNMRSDSNISMVNTLILGDLDADWLRSAGSLKAFGATIQGAFHMRGAMLGLDLDLGLIDVVGPWRPTDYPDSPRASVGTPRSGVDLSNVHVGRQVYLSGATVWHSDIDLSGMIIGGSLWMEKGTKVPWRMTLERARIGDSLMMGEGTFNQVDLTGAQIDHELRLESGGNPTVWKGGRFERDKTTFEAIPIKGDDSTWLGLRHAKIAAIRDTLIAWPDCVILDGFTYDRPPRDYARQRKDAGAGEKYRWCAPPRASGPTDKLPFNTKQRAASLLTGLDWTRTNRWAWLWGEVQDGEENPDDSRSINWWRNWLERDPQLTSQSFLQLAATLKVAGNGARADDVLFEQRIFERDRKDGWKYRIAWIAEILVGFGIGIYALTALFWASLCTLLLTWRLRRRLAGLNHPEASNKGRWWCFFASLQTLIPLVVISKQMDDFLHTPIVKGQPDTQPLRGSLAAWFAALAVLGLVLSGFLLDGLRSYAGL